MRSDGGKESGIVEGEVDDGSDAGKGVVAWGEGGAGEGIAEIVEHAEAGADDGATGAEWLVGDADAGGRGCRKLSDIALCPGRLT